jgi:hypothetical protein
MTFELKSSDLRFEVPVAISFPDEFIIFDLFFLAPAQAHLSLDPPVRPGRRRPPTRGFLAIDTRISAMNPKHLKQTFGISIN